MNNVLRMLNTKQFKEALHEAEKQVILAAFNHAGGNQAKTARLLGVSRGTLINRFKSWKS